jgi:hypothetical protein
LWNSFVELKTADAPLAGFMPDRCGISAACRVRAGSLRPLQRWGTLSGNRPAVAVLSAFHSVSSAFVACEVGRSARFTRR